MRRARTVLVLAVALACAAVPAVASADDTDTTRAEARQLASQGDEAFGIGRCDQAVPLWKEAERKFHAPTILVRIARCEALLGKVVDAASTLEALLAEPVAPDAPAAFVAAHKEAEADLQSVRARIARLAVVVDTSGVTGAPSIEVDGRADTSSELAVDPGKHHVRVFLGDASWEDVVKLGDGELRTVRVALHAEPGAVVTSSQRLVGFVLGGVGIAAMAVGAGYGVLAVQRSHDLLGPCGQDRQTCPPSEQTTIDHIRSDAVVADVAVGGGAALFIAGAVVVLSAPTPRREGPRVQITPWMGAAMGATLRGVF